MNRGISKKVVLESGGKGQDITSRVLSSAPNFFRERVISIVVSRRWKRCKLDICWERGRMDASLDWLCWRKLWAVELEARQERGRV